MSNAIRNVHSMSTYELRQEITRRGAFERFFPKEDKVCYDTLLHAMVTLLKEDQTKEEKTRFAEIEKDAEVTRDRLAAAKAARKADAIARSKAREVTIEEQTWL